MVVTDVQLQNDEELSLKQDKVEEKQKPSEQTPKAEQLDSLRPGTDEANQSLLK